jgi:hypothetical protein
MEKTELQQQLHRLHDVLISICNMSLCARSEDSFAKLLTYLLNCNTEVKDTKQDQHCLIDLPLYST